MAQAVGIVALAFILSAEACPPTGAASGRWCRSCCSPPPGSPSPRSSWAGRRAWRWASRSPQGSCSELFDLATLSQGHLDSLHRAEVTVASTVDDPWRRALAGERLARAHVFVTEGLTGVGPRPETCAARLRHSASAVAMIVVLAVGSISQSRWLLLPLAMVSTLFAMECVGLYERRWTIPSRLASASVQDPVRGVFVMPEPAMARSLAVLAGNDRLVIQQARCLMEAASQDASARRRLLDAERLVADARAVATRTRPPR